MLSYLISKFQQCISSVLRFILITSLIDILFLNAEAKDITAQQNETTQEDKAIQQLTRTKQENLLSTETLTWDSRIDLNSGQEFFNVSDSAGSRCKPKVEQLLSY